MNGQVFWVQIQALSLTSSTFHIFIDEIKKYSNNCKPFWYYRSNEKMFCVCVCVGRRWDKFHLIRVQSSYIFYHQWIANGHGDGSFPTFEL